MVPVGEGIGETKGERAGELCWPATSTRLGRAGLCIGGGGPRSSRREVNATLMSVDGNRMIHLQGEREREREMKVILMILSKLRYESYFSTHMDHHALCILIPGP